jgi:ribonuclease G
MPTVNHINISRRIEDEDEKERLKNLISEIGKPEAGYIVRTAAQGCQENDFEPDFTFLRRLWENVKIKSENSDAFQVLYEDLNLIFRSIRDLCGQKETRVVIDSKEDFQKCRLLIKSLHTS